jgi:hypothetical protein
VANLHCSTNPRDVRLTAAGGPFFESEPEMGGLTPEEQERFAEISRFWVSGGTASDPGAPRVVYGYALAAAHEASHPAQVRATIAAFACDRGLVVGTTFVDQVAPDGSVGRPGLAALLSVLRLPGTHGAVVTDVQDLAPDPAAFEALAETIARTGSTLYVVQRAQVWRPSGVHPNGQQDCMLAPHAEGWRAARAERQKYRWILWGTEDE